MSLPDAAQIWRSGDEDGGSEGGPVFEQPWHAQSLALANALTEAGVFTGAEWSDTLGAALREAEQGAAEDTQETYSGCVLGALEQLLASRTVLDADALNERTEAWRRAYLRTPHGKPVTLDGPDRGDG